MGIPFGRVCSLELSKTRREKKKKRKMSQVNFEPNVAFIKPVTVQDLQEE